MKDPEPIHYSDEFVTSHTNESTNPEHKNSIIREALTRQQNESLRSKLTLNLRIIDDLRKQLATTGGKSEVSAKKLCTCSSEHTATGVILHRDPECPRHTEEVRPVSPPESKSDEWRVNETGWLIADMQHLWLGTSNLANLIATLHNTQVAKLKRWRSLAEEELSERAKTITTLTAALGALMEGGKS